MIKTTVSTQWNGNIVKVQGKKVVNKTGYEVGLVVEGQAKLLAPRDSGHLAASITTQAYDKGTELENPMKYAERNKVWKNDGTFKKIEKPRSDMEILVGTPLSYGPHQEFGTIKMSAQPFLRPALDLAKGKVLSIMKIAGKFIFGDYLK